MGFRCSTRFASFVNNSICIGIFLIGLFHSSPALYYHTLIELFIKFESWLLITSILIMIFSQLFGEKIQYKKKWKLSIIIHEIIESTKCVLVVSALTTFPVTKLRMGYDISLTWDFNEATHIFDNMLLKYMFLFIKTVIIWIFADSWTYFKHFLLHKPVLFAFHKTHHSFGNPTSFASFGISAFEALWTFGPIIIFSYPSLTFCKLYFPIHIGGIIGFATLNLYLHCGYTISFIERTLPYFYINTSAWHNIHHEKTHTNFAEVSPFWDYVLGTYDRDRYQEHKKKFNWRFYDFSSLHQKR